MTAFFRKRTARVRTVFYQCVFAVLFLFPLSVAAQYKLKATPVNQKTLPSLEKVFKKYHLFTINAPELMRNSKAQGRASFKFDLELTGLQSLSLSLTEQDILSESYSMIVAGPNGKKETVRPDIKTYTGWVANEEGSIVALTISDKTIFGHIKGKTTDYFIEPLRYYNKKAAANSFVVYETKDVVPSSASLCGATEVAEKQIAAAETSATTLGSATGTCKIIEMAVATDATIFEKYGSAELVEEHNISIMNTMVLLYSNAQIGSSYLQFRIKRNYVSTSAATDPYLLPTNPTGSEDLLQMFRLWGSAGGFGIGFNFDLGQLWTMKNIIPDNGGVVGLAFVGAVCSSAKYQVNRDLFSQTGLQAGVLAAHETGHNLSAQHDASGAPYIMAPSLADPPNTVFSSASILSMTNYLNSSLAACISGCNTEPPTAGFNLPKFSCSNTFNLNSASVGSVNGVFWETPGGNPATSNAQSLTVQYATPGLKTIALTAYNNNVTSTVVKQVFINSGLPNGCRTITGTGPAPGAFANFKLNDLEHVFGGTYGSVYRNNTCTEVVSLTPGETYTYKGTVGLPFINVSSTLQVFIDYNADGDFLDENEAVHTSPECIMGEYSFSFTVPSNVTVSDNPVRMRVVGLGCGATLGNGCNVAPNSMVVDFGVLFLPAEKFYYVDRDRDGYGNPNSKAWLRSETAPPGYSTTGDDCNDDFPWLNPATVWVKDADNDFYYTGDPIVQCTSPGAGYTYIMRNPGDCDDTKKEINPLTVWVKDEDGDHHYTGAPVTQCEKPGDGYVIQTIELIAGDCNDADHTVFENQTYYKDEDGDGFGNIAKPIAVCSSTAPAGYVTNSGDCNDSNPAISPAAVEVCGNQIDDNCDGVIDEVACYTCTNANGLTVTDVTANSVRLSWSAIANPEQWQLQYKAIGKGSSKWMDIFLTGNIRSVTIPNLVSNQNYQWQIRAKCGKSWTAYLAGSNFRTSATTANRSADDLFTGNANAAMQLYPNPSNGNFTLNLQLEQAITSTANISIRDIAGKLLFTEKVNVVNGLVCKNIQLPGYATAGMYFIEVSANGKWFKTKLIVTK
ncbi:M12 family metallo-peptidase [Lacibacter sediminis]|uniref:T9SS type A sorting domain-containing protein n=1 Tax=Lacibacter sediminis TaxID=2760713 RepID=A0A7G5XKP6_9BACT|nr:M12 family metallo-peptidase [Lacibacter sediminis]QNA46049.1 T9SS type A sorting domain-containing protein [Lacibacter sediminis]